MQRSLKISVSIPASVVSCPEGEYVLFSVIKLEKKPAKKATKKPAVKKAKAKKKESSEDDDDEVRLHLIELARPDSDSDNLD